MKSDRLVVLVTREEKRRLLALAKARQSSVGELVREAVSRLDAPQTAIGNVAQEVASKRSAEEVSLDELQRHLGTIWAELRAATSNSGMPEPPPRPEEPQLSPDQVAALERLAEIALRTMQRANAALDKAFDEVEATKAYFAAKRSEESKGELVRQDR